MQEQRGRTDERQDLSDVRLARDAHHRLGRGWARGDPRVGHPRLELVGVIEHPGAHPPGVLDDPRPRAPSVADAREPLVPRLIVPRPRVILGGLLGRRCGEEDERRDTLGERRREQDRRFAAVPHPEERRLRRSRRVQHDLQIGGASSPASAPPGSDPRDPSHAGQPGSDATTPRAGKGTSRATGTPTRTRGSTRTPTRRADRGRRHRPPGRPRRHRRCARTARRASSGDLHGSIILEPAGSGSNRTLVRAG